MVTGGDAIYQTLRALGVDTIFGIVSIHNVPIFDAVAREGGIRIITVRHEQAAAHAADGYARATGRLGVALASTGPGTTNTMTGLYEAAFASSPVLLITGQIETRYLGRGRGALHEADRQAEMLATVCRRVESPRRPDQVVPALRRVAEDVLTGRPQPGAVEVPIDLQQGSVPEAPAAAPSPSRVPLDERALERSAEALRDSRRRVIWAGGGVVRAGASEELVRLATALDAPVVTSLNGRGSIPEDHPLCIGPFTTDRNVREVLADAEVVLACGTRFRQQDTGGFSLTLPENLIHLDADPGVFGLTYQPQIRCLGDAKLGLQGLASTLGDAPGDTEFRDRALKAGATAREGARGVIGGDYGAIMDYVREALPRDARLVRDATVPAYMWGDRLLPTYAPGTSISPTSSAIGPGLPLAVGAAVGTDRPTLLIAGDGGFMLHLSELTTAAELGCPLKVLLFNDGGYGVLRMIQSRRYEGRTYGVDLHTPQFTKVAESVGMGTEAVQDVEAFRAAFDRAMATDGPYLLEVDMTALEAMGGLGAGGRRQPQGR